MNLIKVHYRTISATIIVVLAFWIFTGMLFGFGLIKPLHLPVSWAGFFSFLGDPPVVAGLCVLSILIPRFRNTIAFPVCAAVLVSSAIYLLLRIIFAADTLSLPQLATGSSPGFPSGHALNNASLYTMLSIQTFAFLKKLINKICLGLFFMFIIFVVGISRISLGIHSEHEVLGGWLIGFILAYIVLFITNAIISARKKKTVPS